MTDCWFESVVNSVYPRVELKGQAIGAFSVKTTAEIRNSRFATGAGTVNAVVITNFGSVNIENCWLNQQGERPSINLNGTRKANVKNVYYTSGNSVNYSSTEDSVRITGAYQLTSAQQRSTRWEIGGVSTQSITNLVLDSSFTSGHRFIAGGGANPPILTHETADGFSDNFSAKIQFNIGAGGVSNAARLTDGVLSAVAGKYMNISFRVKGALSQTINPVITGTQGVINDRVLVNTDWTHVEYKILVPASGFYYLYFYPPGDVAQTIWVDDVVIAQTDLPIDNLPNLVNYSTTATLATRPGVNLPIFNIGPIRVSYGNAAPTIGTWARGDVVYNTAPAASGFVGWSCVTAGTPGTWKTFGAISA